MKADWKSYTSEDEEKITNLDPVPKNYASFCKTLKDPGRSTSHRVSTNHTPLLVPRIRRAAQKNETSGDRDIATELLALTLLTHLDGHADRKP